MLDFDEVTKCRDIREVNDFIDRYVEERDLKGETKHKQTWALFYTWRQSFLKREVKNLNSFVQKIKGCNRCEESPIVFIREKQRKIGLCQEHWEKLADSEISFSTEEDLVSSKEGRTGHQKVTS